MTPLEKLQKRDEYRLKVLRSLFEEAGGSGAENIGLDAGALGMTDDELKAAAKYLDGKGLVEVVHVMDEGVVLRLTNAGIDEIESTIRNPNQRTDHFAPVVINVVNTWIENSSVGAVQIDGDGNSAGVTQTLQKDAR